MISFFFDLLALFGLIHFGFTINQLLLGEFIKKKNIVKYKTMNMSCKESVVILIPVCDESSSVIRETLQACNKLSSPYELIVLENSRDIEKKRYNIVTCNELNVSFYSFNNLGNKAKALNWFLSSEKNKFDYFIILDADQHPVENMVEILLHHIKINNNTAIVQTPQEFRNSRKNIFTFFYCNMQDVFYKVIAELRGNVGFATCFGTNFIAKSEYLEKVGWFDEDCITEDTATSLKITSAGYKIEYLPVVLASGLAPDDLKSISTQLGRYAKGNRQFLLHILTSFRSILNSKISIYLFICYIHYSSSLITSAMFIFICFFCGWIQLGCIVKSVSCILILLYLLLLTRSCSLEKVIAGAFFFTVMSPIYLFYSLNVLDNSVFFQVTPKR